MVDAWPTLPEPIRRAVLALVGSMAPVVGPGPSGNTLDDALPPGYERTAGGSGVR